MAGLRERKKQRTRRALVEAAYDLFARKGYDETTIVEIAEAADVSVGTFFNHFPVKEDVLFADADELLAAVGVTIAESEKGPAQALGDALRDVFDAERDFSDQAEAARLQMIMFVPALQAATARRLLEAQHVLTTAIRQAFPDYQDAAVLVGAMVGGVSGVIQDGLVREEPLPDILAAGRRAIDTLVEALK